MPEYKITWQMDPEDEIPEDREEHLKSVAEELGISESVGYQRTTTKRLAEDPTQLFQFCEVLFDDPEALFRLFLYIKSDPRSDVQIQQEKTQEVIDERIEEIDE